MIRQLAPTPRARRQRRRVVLWALWCASWVVLGVVVTWDAAPGSGPLWNYLALMAASGLGAWWVTR